MVALRQNVGTTLNMSDEDDAVIFPIIPYISTTFSLLKRPFKKIGTPNKAFKKRIGIP